MTAKIYDATAKRWRLANLNQWNSTRGAWEPCSQVGADPLPGLEYESMFSPYIGQGTIWQRDVTSMPIASNSAQLANWMWTKTPTPYNNANGNPSGAFGSKTSFNTSAYGTSPIPAYVVDSSHPNARFQYMDSVSGPNMTTAATDAYLKGPIPWPTGMLPAPMGDKSIAFYDKATGIMREYFFVAPVTNKPGHWTASTGGYSVVKPYFEDIATTNYATQLQGGSSAVALMHNSLGFIGINDVRVGVIDHALAYTTANFTAGVQASYPAIWSDGKFPPQSWSGWDENGGSGNGPWPGTSPRHGQWCRLPMSVDPEYNPRTGLAYKPLTKLVIRAAQKYGMCPTDTNAWCHAINGESGNREKAMYGVDPWASNGELAQILNPPDPASAFAIDDFPWDLTQWAPVDWGRPNPDFYLRPDEVWPYEPHSR